VKAAAVLRELVRATDELERWRPSSGVPYGTARARWARAWSLARRAAGTPPPSKGAIA